MILQELSKCYDKLKETDKENVPDLGYSRVLISATMIITEEGEFDHIVPAEKGEEREVPLQKRRSGKNPPSYFLCDFSCYFLGKRVNKKGKLEDCSSYLENAYQLHNNILKNSTNSRAKAILKFLEKQKEHPTSFNQEDYELGRIVFRVKDDKIDIHNDPEIKDLWIQYLPKYMEDEKKPNEIGQCLVSGKENQIICRTHNSVPIPGGESNGSSVVSFNNDSFNSYGKVQSNNSPISFEGMFKYTTALKYLLKCQDNKCMLQNTVCVFWTTSKTYIEMTLTKAFIAGQYEEDKEEIEEDSDVIDIEDDENLDFKFDLDSEIELPDENRNEVTKEIMNKIVQGQSSQDITEFLERHQAAKVYLLGLTPNKARVAVKFFYECSFGNFVRNIQAHYQRLTIEQSVKYPISMRNLLEASTREGKLKKNDQDKEGGVCDPLIKDRLLGSIINNTSYPISLFYKCITRYIIDHRSIAKAEASEATPSEETKKLRRLNNIRVAFIKAYLIKEQEVKKQKVECKEEIIVGLNKDNLNVGYNLGRLFAVLEKTQKEAGNETLSERYFSGACTTPAVMFTTLLKLNKSHLVKIEKKEELKGLAGYYEGLNSEILDHIERLPNSLSQEDQGYFILGYYHQKKDLYTKKENKNIEELKRQDE